MMDTETEHAGSWPQDTSMRERTMMLLLSLFLILLAFFVQMNVFATKDPSRADSALNSVSETFGKSSLDSGEGVVASSAGVMIIDMPYLQAVVSAMRGRDSMGAVTAKQSDGTLTVNLSLDRLFLTNTGVMHPDGVAYSQALADIMMADNSGNALRSLEIRLILPPDQLLALETLHMSDAVPIRQSAAMAMALTQAGVAIGAISTSLVRGDGPSMQLRFYSLNGAAQDAEAR